MPGLIPWIDAFARTRGLRYEPDADERWLRAWEPYTTLKVPFRYEHALSATGGGGSITVARAVLSTAPPSPPPGIAPDAYEIGTWIAIVQDVRITTKAAATSDFGTPFAESLDLVSMPRLPTGDPAFDHVFASYAKSAEDLASGLTASVRKLLLSWRIPVHAETRPGGFILAPTALGPDDRSLAWMLDAIHYFGQKATKAGA